MLFTVPDDLPGGAPSQGKSASVKVELDIEDAPFLQEPEEKKAPPKAPAEPAPPPPSVQTKASASSSLLSKLEALLSNKKRLALIGGGLLVLLLAPLVLNLLLSKAPPPPPKEEEVRRVVPGPPPRADAPAGPKFLFKSGTFFIERRGSEGEVRFLRCRFAVPTDNPILYAELQAKNIAVRDAIYYYLNNKPLTFLSDDMQTEVMKKDLISVVNEHISSEKIQELYIEEYLVTRL